MRRMSVFTPTGISKDNGAIHINAMIQPAHLPFSARANGLRSTPLRTASLALGVAKSLLAVLPNPRARPPIPALDPDDYKVSQTLGAALRAEGSNGIVYPSVRCEGGECVGLFYPDLASNPVPGRHLDYHWNGERVDFYRDNATGQVYRIV